MAKVDTSRVLSLILGGGKGTRLFPLTKERSKPAVSFGGKYRIVDIPISNSINSGFKKIYILTQFNSESLHHHIVNSYSFDRFSGGFVHILAAEQTFEHAANYEGTADAVRKNLCHFRPQHPSHYIILSGDQLYQMDLKAFLDSHVASGADVTIATTTVNRRDASGFGIMKIDENKRIVEFQEKPAPDKNIDDWKIPANARDPDLPADKEYLASMGIYIFNANTMEELLDNDKTDFGKEIIPMSIKSKKVNSYIYDGYWEDIGTIRSFYEATLELTSEKPRFDLFNEAEPIYTHPRNLPPCKISNTMLTESIASDGCIINEGTIVNSVIGVRSIIGSGTTLKGVISMGADYYESEEEKRSNKKAGIPNIGIGRHCLIQKTIIDKDARIGDHCSINASDKVYPDGENKVGNVTFYSSEGIIIIPKDTIVPDKTEI